MDPLVINDTLTIPVADLEWVAVRSSGPGGQNVNKVSSKVELRFDLSATTALDAGTHSRLRVIAKHRLDADGKILVTSQLTRDQSRNLEDARKKLRELVLQALERPKPRKATKVSRAAKARRVNEKRINSARKKDRAPGRDDH